MPLAPETTAQRSPMMPSRLGIYCEELARVLRDTRVSLADGRALALEAGMQRALEFILGTARRDGSGGLKLILIGNGGSAALASHAQNDLCKAAGLRAMVFNEPSLLTALANDLDYASAFEALAELWAEPGDVLLAISSSGKSANILRACTACAARGCRIVTFSGFTPDNPLRHLGDVNFWVPSSSYGHVELAHSVLLHFLSDQAVQA